MDYGDPDVPTLAKMTEAEHSDLVEGGCDPHCHACDRKIEVGDWWGFKTFIPRGAVLGVTGLVLDSTIRGTCCDVCMKADRGLSDEEKASLEKRLRAALEVPKKPAKPKEPDDRKEHPRNTHHGCFVLDDGTRF